MGGNRASQALKRTPFYVTRGHFWKLKGSTPEKRKTKPPRTPKKDLGLGPTVNTTPGKALEKEKNETAAERAAFCLA